MQIKRYNIFHANDRHLLTLHKGDKIFVINKIKHDQLLSIISYLAIEKIKYGNYRD